MAYRNAQTTVEPSRRSDASPREGAAAGPPLGGRIFSLRNIASVPDTVGAVPGVPAGPQSRLAGGLDDCPGDEPGAVRARPRDLLLLVPLARPALEGAARQPQLRPSLRAAHALGPRTDQDYVRSLVRQLRYRRPPRRRLPRVFPEESRGRLLRRDARHRSGRAAPGPRGAGCDDGSWRAGGLRALAADRSPPGAHRRPDPLGRWDHRAPGDATFSAGVRADTARTLPRLLRPPRARRPRLVASPPG